MYQLYIYVLFGVLVVVLLKACRAFYMLGKQSTSGLQPHALSSHCSVITPSHVHGMHSDSSPHLPPHFLCSVSTLIQTWLVAFLHNSVPREITLTYWVKEQGN